MITGWRKSSYSESTQGQCVEVGVGWRKSSYSQSTQGQCVEIAAGETAVGVRDTKDRERGHLTVSRTAWRAFVGSLSA
ncbi:MAG TPA: DUF397 domain-containing protein [Streptosporangiaceae bacterium]|jgi:hypothetical protein